MTMQERSIDISNLNKAEVLRLLYNASQQQGMGFLDYRGASHITKEEAEKLLKENTYFDYLYGRVMKVDLSGDVLHTHLYDRDNGPGAARKALAELIGNK